MNVGTIFVLTRGGFGNVLFNYLIGYSLGKKYSMNVKYVQGDPNRTDRPVMKLYQIFNKLNLSMCEDYNRHNAIIIGEPAFTYQDIKITHPYINHILDGYFQSYKYSLDFINPIKTEILALMSSPKLVDMISNYRHGNKKLIMIHVRRGDYLNHPDYHPVPPSQYYQTAISTIIGTDHNLYKLIVFSDDIPYIKNWHLPKQYDHEIIELSNVEEVFFLMTMMDHYVIANSSLSLLAYYFRQNQDASLFMPRHWFGPRGPRFKHDDLVEMTNNVHVL